MVKNTHRAIACMIKRFVSGAISALSALSASVATLPTDSHMSDIPLAAIIATLVAFFAGVYTPSRKSSHRVDDVDT